MLLIIRELQIKTTMRYHLTVVIMAIIKKSMNYKCWGGCTEKETLLYYWWESKLVQPLWRTVWKFLKKKNWKQNFHMNQQSPCWAYTQRKPELKETRVPNVHCCNSQDMGATQMSIGRQMGKEVVVHMHNGILLSYKKEPI